MGDRPGQWSSGRAVVERLLDEKKIATCRPDEAKARALIARARTHLVTARQLASAPNPDTEVAADALHAANRKACEAVLLVQGLESTKDGGHTAAAQVVREQARGGGPVPATFGVFETVRQIRHAGDYGNMIDDLPADDILENLDGPIDLVDACEKMISIMPIYVDTRRLS